MSCATPADRVSYEHAWSPTDALLTWRQAADVSNLDGLSLLGYSLGTPALPEFRSYFLDTAFDGAQVSTGETCLAALQMLTSSAALPDFGDSFTSALLFVDRQSTIWSRRARAVRRSQPRAS